MSETILENASVAMRFGKSRPGGPPRGPTARQRHTAELIEKFTLTHGGRLPGVVERGTIANIAAMMAKSNARHGVSAEQLVRLSNSIARLVEKLGLAGAPSPKPDPYAGLDKLKDHCAGIEGKP